MPVINAKGLIAERAKAIHDFHEETGCRRAELDVSGGVDSAVVLGLLAHALGPDNITAAYIGIHSNNQSLERAREVAKWFNVKLIEIDLTKTFEGFIEQATAQMRLAKVHRVSLDTCDNTVLGSIRSTLRATAGRAFNRMAGGGIRHGTGNECEDRWARFYQKGGDGEVDTNPIAMLSKGEVFQVGRALGVPVSILAARPSPDLWAVGDVHNDEDEYDSYFNVQAQPWYSYIDLKTGDYKSIGTIERVSRFADIIDNSLFNSWMLHKSLTDEAREMSTQDLVNHALETTFKGYDPLMARKVLLAARRAELTTRHKFNPNCPALGERSALVRDGLLTNNLPNFNTEGKVQ